MSTVVIVTVPVPPTLGRGAVVNGDAKVPEAWRGAAEVSIDETVLGAPAATVDTLHRRWVAREPTVVRLFVDAGVFRSPESIRVEPWRLDPSFEPFFDRLHFLVWANNYDVRSGGEPIWWWTRKALRLGATEGPADVVLPDGTDAWIDGGPRGPLDIVAEDRSVVVAAESIESGSLAPDRAEPPAGPEVAPDQLAAVAHSHGPARVIAPAGSGKTRVLTERLSHLIGDRGWQSEGILAVAYNTEAKAELERRTASFSPQIRTLNSLGLWVLRTYRGRLPTVLGEREVRRLVESLLPGKRRHRANTDPIGPYLEALSAVRLGLCDPAEVEARRDDVDGFAETFAPFRSALASSGAVDFDEQIYAAIECLLGDGPFRRRMQQACRHLLVDEFQDLTPGHVLLLRLLALPALDVFAVGDDDQVIYGHNAADPAFLIDFDRLFPGMASHPLKVNYRCPRAVVGGARSLLSYNHRRLDKEIESGPGANADPDALAVIRHDPGASSSTLVDTVQAWLGEGIEASDVAVVARVNSTLLAPQVALRAGGIPTASGLGPEILNRTGLRAALAYLRMATSSDHMATPDIVEILRRPTRSLPRWFPERLERRASWSPARLRTIADQVPEADAHKVVHLADDLALVAEVARTGTTRATLEAIRDQVGLGSAMGLLDGGADSRAQGSSHLDDLEGLVDVADLHPDPVGFEAWLRSSLEPPTNPEGVVLSTIHRVKGREWPRVVVFGVNAGLMPHRLSKDIEEERRILHVAITRAQDAAVVLADGSRPSPFLDEITGTAPKRPMADRAPWGEAPSTRTSSKRSPRAPGSPKGMPASEGMVLVVSGGHEGAVTEADAAGATIHLAGGSLLRVRFGERVRVDGTPTTLARPERLWGEAAEAELRLRDWRRDEARRTGRPAYTVLSDADLLGIALARPADAAALAACNGIGPTKLERWGDDILRLVEPADH